MCDQTPLHYKHGDIVWVKLGVCWWPGEVVDFDKLPEEIQEGFKKPSRKLPLVTVTFFQEDSYEFVKNLNQIYSYNCNKKDDFIKKGMDLHRAKNYSFMEKFPSDICTAERKTNGNEQILDDPKYGPDKKIDFVSLIFGTPSPKKAKETKGKRSSIKSSPAQKKTPAKTEPNITHPRFTGNDDHQVRMLMQHSNKPEDKKENTYTCQSCDFTSNRIDVIVMHNKYHIQGVYTPIRQTKKTPKRTPAKKSTKRLLKIPSSKTSCIDEDIARLEQGLALSDEDDEDEEEESEEEEPKPKRKQKPKSPKKSVKKPKVEEEKVEKITDIRVNLLAEWDDEEEEEEECKKDMQSTSVLSETDKVVDKSCFDFKEDDEVAEKIPRVVPDKRKSAEPTEDPNLPTAEDDINRTIISKATEPVPVEPEVQKETESNTKEPDLEAFNAILESTSVTLPEIPQLLKCEQNFHKTKTIKFPDKSATPDKQKPEVATKLTNPKKRFVKSFEDFEQSLKREKIDEDQKSKPEVRNDEKCSEQITKSLTQHNEIKCLEDVVVNKQANEENSSKENPKDLNAIKLDLDIIEPFDKKGDLSDLTKDTTKNEFDSMDIATEKDAQTVESKEDQTIDKTKTDIEKLKEDDTFSKNLKEDSQKLDKVKKATEELDKVKEDEACKSNIEEENKFHIAENEGNAEKKNVDKNYEEKTKNINKVEKKLKKSNDKVVNEKKKDVHENMIEEDDKKLHNKEEHKKSKKMVEDKVKDRKSLGKDKRNTRGKNIFEEHKNEDRDNDKELNKESLKSDLINEIKNKSDSIVNTENKKQETKDTKSDTKETVGRKKELKLKDKKISKEESDSKNDMKKQKAEVKSQKEKRDIEEIVENEPRKDRRSSRYSDLKKSEVSQKKDVKQAKPRKNLHDELANDSNQSSTTNKTIEPSDNEVIKEETSKGDYKKQKKSHKDVVNEQEDSQKRRSSLRKNPKEEKYDSNTEDDLTKLKDISDEKKKGKDAKKSKIDDNESSEIVHVAPRVDLSDNIDLLDNKALSSRSTRGKSQESNRSNDVKKTKDSKTEKDHLDVDEKIHSRRPKKSWDSFEKRMKLRQEREYEERIREERIREEKRLKEEEEERIREEKRLKEEEEERIEAENQLKIKEAQMLKEEEEKNNLIQNDQEEREVQENDKKMDVVEEKADAKLEFSLDQEEHYTTEKNVKPTKEVDSVKIKSDIEIPMKTFGAKGRRSRRKTRESKELDENIKVGYSKESIADVNLDEKQVPSTSKDTTKNTQSDSGDKPKNVTETEYIRPLKKSRDNFEKRMKLREEREAKSEETFHTKKVKLNDEQKPAEIIPSLDEDMAENKSPTRKLPLEVAKLKTQLMNKLNERGTRKRTQSTDLHLQSKHKHLPDTPTRKTRIKTESIRRLSLQSQEISIEKSIDKIEVTINKEEEMGEHILSKDMIVDENSLISGNASELHNLEIFSTVEKEDNVTFKIDTPVISNDATSPQQDNILEKDSEKDDKNTDRVADNIEELVVNKVSPDNENAFITEEKDIEESNNISNVLLTEVNIEEKILEGNELIEIPEKNDLIISSNKIDDISKDFVTDIIDNKLNIDKIDIFEETPRIDNLHVENTVETAETKLTELNKESEFALSNQLKLVESETIIEEKEKVVLADPISIVSDKESNDVPNIPNIGDNNECASVSQCATDIHLPELVSPDKDAKEPDQKVLQTVETCIEKEHVDSSEPVEGIQATLEQTIKDSVVPEPSGLNTLAAISELTFDSIPDEKEISIDKNLTVVSASDLGDGQVEIANIPIMEEGTIKAATIVDYTGADDITTATKTHEIVIDRVIEKEKPLEKTIELPQTLEEDIKESISTVESEMAKLTDNKTDPVATQPQESTSSSKLLEILTDAKIQKPSPSFKLREKVSTPQLKISNPKFETVTPPKSKTKLVIRSSLPSSSKSNKPIIISERIIKPAQSSQESNMVSVQKVSSKRSFDDIEDAFDTYIIKKPIKKALVEQSPEVVTQKKIIPMKNKTKIINQTIITSTGKVIQPSIPKTSNDNVFDIDSMPIVLSDQILTPESIENMPIMIQEPPKQVMKKVPQKILNKSASPVIMKDSTFRSAQPTKTYPKIVKTATQKVYQSATPTLLKHSPTIISQAGKPGKYMIVPSEASTPTGSKYTVGKRIIKKSPAIISSSKVQSTVPEPTGNKIMIVTNNQGQQSRVILTPAQQKKMGYQTTVKKANFKTVVQKDTSKSPNIISQTIINSKGQITTTTNPGVFTSSTSSLSQIKRPRIETKNKIIGQRLLQGGLNQIKNTSGQPRTIIIKNPQGQTVKRIQGTDDALLEQQVAEQIEAINRAATKSQTYKSVAAKRQTYQKKFIPDNKPKMVINSVQTKASSIPPLAPISPNKKAEALAPKISKPSPSPVVQSSGIEKSVEKSPEKTETKRTPHQLVIQDALGNQTTITEGQILALPSETVDGQPQSYMLVTLDETGNLTPLNNEALMSLDPNLGGDLSNMVLQIDQGAAEDGVKIDDSKEEIAEETKIEEKVEKVEEPPQAEAMQTVACAINNGDSSQQLIITGDPISTQKFLESLTEGNADFANLLANAEGNILIQADGQQILINNDSESQMLFTDSLEGGEGSGNPVFSSPAPKNQDILAAALADTDVFQQEQPKLSPGGPLYPMNVNNVLETSSMNSPIMTPLEIPSTNSKKIEEEAVILTSAPKNVDLPITITDPNISQSVAHQQVTLDLPLAIQDVAVTSAEMNSPNFAYSLSTLDEKPFTTSISMPLLTEEPEETTIEKPPESEELKSDLKEEYLLSSGPLCGTMNSQMCSSLSEPPPDMFDFTIEQSFEMKQDGTASEFNSNSTDDSCEIPVQPEIVTKTVSSPKRCFEEDLENEKKKCKFD